MLQVVNRMIHSIQTKENTVLVGIIESSGSLPRKEGTFMLVGKTGLLVGTIGGGNMEYQAIRYAMGMQGLHSQVEEYELNPGDSAALGMVCGGRAKLLFYPIPWDNAQILLWAEEWQAALLEGREHKLVFRDLENGSILAEKMIRGDGVVYLFGAGHLAREVVPLLSHLDFRCVVLDDRKEFADAVFFPQAKEVRLVDFNHLEGVIKANEMDYFVIMTRGHQGDMEAEAFALRTPAGYIGVVGSRKKTAYVNERLLERGFTPKDLARVVTPIGIAIGSETPAEIAVSIAAQLIQVRADRRKG